MENTLVITPDRKSKLKKLLLEMQQGLLERETQTKLILLAALAGEHVLLLGPPGTAKSELAKRLKSIFVEANYFERLLTRFSVPEELFGPLSIRALEEDRYNRLTSGYLPEASVAFIDEIFKANSAILNSLLTLLNERQFDNGNRRHEVPLISVIAASNELPEGEELTALYDRFMLRSFVEPVSDNAFRSLLCLESDECDPDLATRLRVDELKEVQALSAKVTLSSSVLVLCEAFRKYLVQENIYVSDRRWRKIIKLLQVSAFTNNQTEVSVYDAWLLPHCLWETPDQLEGLIKLYKTNIAIDGDFQPTRLTKVLLAWEAKLELDRNNKQHVHNEKGDPLFVGKKGEPILSKSSKKQKLDDEGKPLFDDGYGEETYSERSYGSSNKPLLVDTPNQPFLATICYSAAHIESRVEQVQKLQREISTFHDLLCDQRSSAARLLSDHIWADASILPELSESLQTAIQQTERLLERTDKLINGFNELPRESEDLESFDGPQEPEVIEGELCD
ncbi:AAA family ATPase [Pontibacterium granulatum]|uniref:AAA family ATPase n=1 Tax=Pontibacterium granulatum TaxID=2036029 RepID=UPI002499C1CA|nr:AAA family ATPase [Pontibacterium granulatum]MDI3323399.1 AAA family ATPase [Pontibacterium granulatum]